VTTRTTTRSTGYDRRPAAGRRPAQRVPHLEHLELSALREYRQDLLTEESRVSYWRRILQARLDNAVAKKRITSAQEQKLLKALSTGIDAMVNIPAPKGPRFGGPGLGYQRAFKGRFPRPGSFTPAAPAPGAPAVGVPAPAGPFA